MPSRAKFYDPLQHAVSPGLSVAVPCVAAGMEAERAYFVGACLCKADLFCEFHRAVLNFFHFNFITTQYNGQ
jgi:hypothetical protein